MRSWESSSPGCFVPWQLLLQIMTLPNHLFPIYHRIMEWFGVEGTLKPPLLEQEDLYSVSLVGREKRWRFQLDCMQRNGVGKLGELSCSHLALGCIGKGCATGGGGFCWWELMRQKCCYKLWVFQVEKKKKTWKKKEQNKPELLVINGIISVLQSLGFWVTCSDQLCRTDVCRALEEQSSTRTNIQKEIRQIK